MFSGAGGMSIGAQRAGIDIKIAVEKDPMAARTFAVNHPEVNVIEADISAIDRLHLGCRSAPLVVFGGPPCQGFSTSNQRTRTLENPNNWLFEEFLRHVRLLEPEHVVIENVKGLSETEKGKFLEMICNQIADLGYAVDFKTLNAFDFGVPQSRSRLFIIASKLRSPTFPAAGKRNPVTVAEALMDLPKLANGASVSKLRYRTPAVSSYAKNMRGRKLSSENNIVSKNADFIIERYQHIPQGGNWESIPDELMKNYKDHSRCHTGVYRRLKLDEPSVVIGNYRKNMLIHPTENRGLSVREAARIQSFPDKFIFSGSIGFQQQQVGNAVPPLLAQSVFENLAGECHID